MSDLKPKDYGAIAERFDATNPDLGTYVRMQIALEALPRRSGAAVVKALEDDEEPLHLTHYEIQVLLGTSIHGCNMSPDRVFSLNIAWHRLHAIGLIDRTDGLAIITKKGEQVVDRIRAALTPGGQDAERP